MHGTHASNIDSEVYSSRAVFLLIARGQYQNSASTILCWFFEYEELRAL